MQEPKYVLSSGTKIRTHEALQPTTGMIIKQEYLDRRRPDAAGVLGGFVPGHGGDIYWVRHEDDKTVAVYGWMEFELVEADDGQRDSSNT